jgi:hypothetical protein
MDGLIAAGFQIIRSMPRDEWMSSALLPSRILSLSDCICPQFPGWYAFSFGSESDEERREAFHDLGVSAHQQQAAIDWATEHFGVTFGSPGVYYSLAEASADKHRFFPERDDIAVLGAGLPGEFVDCFLAHTIPPPTRPGFAPNGESGWREVVKERKILPEGTVLGFELLDVEIGVLAHSWLCNGLETTFADKLGVRPNEHGYIACLDDAKRCCEEIERGRVGAEPGLWLPWGIVRYA